jgi:galactokinase
LKVNRQLTLELATSDSLHESIASARRQYSARFGGDPQWVVAAPGRVNLIGEHIDYNDGFVLPMAIDRYCVVAGGPAEGNSAAVYSANADEQVAISLIAPQRNSNPGHSSNYVAGVIAGCRRLMPVCFDGFAALVTSDVVTLSSSSR